MSKNTICFNIHPIKTLCYKLKTGKTLVFKGRLRANTGIGLNTYPMSTGEILEQVCKMFTDGYTEGNRSIKVIGDTVTYNTASTDKGDLYCIAYKDGGFYVGKRTNEDYEPKEGDWWCYGFYSNLYNVYSDYLPQDLIFNSYSLAYPKRYDKIVTNYIEQNQLQSTIGAWSKLNSNTTPIQYRVVSARNGLFIDYHNVNRYDDGILVRIDTSLGAKDDLDVNRMPRIGMLFKPISASDILSYQNTGKMGGIILGEEINVSYSSNHTSCSITIDSAKDYAIFFFDVDNNLINVEYATQNRHGAKGTIYNANATNIYNIYATQLFDKMYIYNKDFEAVYDDGVISRGMTLNLTNDGIVYAYTIRAFKVLQNNMPTTLNSLNTNLLNSNQTDINPINDEQNEV